MRSGSRSTMADVALPARFASSFDHFMAEASSNRPTGSPAVPKAVARSAMSGSTAPRNGARPMPPRVERRHSPPGAGSTDAVSDAATTPASRRAPATRSSAPIPFWTVSDVARGQRCSEDLHRVSHRRPGRPLDLPPAGLRVAGAALATARADPLEQWFPDGHRDGVLLGLEPVRAGDAAAIM